MLVTRLNFRFIIVLSLFFCSITAPYAQEKGQLNIAMMHEPLGLDPIVDRSNTTQKITYQNIFEGLTQIDRSNKVVPSLASSWQIDKTGMIYTFNLRKKIFFHDRTLLTATIVKASLERMIDFEKNNPIKSKFTKIKDISVVSQNVIKVQLTWPDNDFLYDLGLPSAVIQHPQSWANNKQIPIGTGPYRFVNWESSKHITLARNNHYWGDLASIKNIKIVFAKRRSQIVKYLASGALDGYSNITEASFWNSFLDVRHDYVLKIGNTNGKIIIAMNHENEALALKEVRQGIAQAIDKKVIADTPDFITGTEIGSHYSPGDAAYVDLTQAYPFNITDAKMLILKSGTPIKPLTLLLPPPAYAKTISVHVEKMLRDAGVRINIEDVTWEEWFTRVYKEKDYDLTIIAHTEPHDLDIYARDDYYFNYDNRDYKNIIGQLNISLQKDKREELLKKAQQILSDDVANIFLFMLPKEAIWHNKLRGYWLNEPIPALIFSQMYWQE